MAQEVVESKNEGRKAIEIVNEHISNNKTCISFEYYPPKTEKGVEALKKRLYTMKSWNPEWMDVTWGAGGSTSDLTPEICNHIQNNVKGNCMMHLTCTNMKKEKIDIALSKAKKMGLKNILALRGDPPEGEKEWKAGDSAFTCALDLIKYIKSTYGDYFGITISGYPEGHPIARKKIKLSCDNWDPIKNEPFYWAPRKDEDGDWEGVSKQDWKKELDYLKAKVDAGGQLIITQLFYDSKVFIDFVSEARKVGIKVPILPGIMPIRSYGMFGRMTSFCRTVIPQDLRSKLEELKDNDNDKELMLYGLEYITKILNDIKKANIVPGFHIYTMNLEFSTIALLKMNNFGDKDFIKKEYLKSLEQQEEKWKAQTLKKQQKKAAAAAAAAKQKEEEQQKQKQEKQEKQEQQNEKPNGKPFKPMSTF